MITTDISHFVAPYDELNAVNEIPASRLSVAHAVMMVGKAGYRDVRRAGILRLAQLLCTTLANTRSIGRRVCLDSSFYDLEKSEKDSVTYILGMGLTKRTAEALLNIPWLVHLTKLDDAAVKLSKRGTPTAPKVQLYRTTRVPRSPDLVGFDLDQAPHVFEAKGTGGDFVGTNLQHAIGQVSQVETVNGEQPRTRVACYFTCSAGGMHGRIVDPEGDAPPLRFTFDVNTFFREYYREFLYDPAWGNARQERHADNIYRVRDLGVPGLVFGIREDFLKTLQGVQPAQRIFALARDIPAVATMGDADEDESISLSRDGTVLIDVRARTDDLEAEMPE